MHKNHPHSRSTSMIGPDAKMNFLQRYRNIDRVNEWDSYFNTKADPMTAYLASVKEKGLRPEMMGIVKRKGDENDINIRRYGIGDSYAEVLGHGIS